MMNEIPSPVPCAFHDELELRALRHQLCRLILLDDSDRAIVLETTIETLTARNGREFALLESGLHVPLDRILSVDDIRP
jgi:transcriptional antiterminator Rof (Rho-off)